MDDALNPFKVAPNFSGVAPRKNSFREFQFTIDRLKSLSPVLRTAPHIHLLRATGVIAGTRHAVARGATLRRTIVNIPARLARPQRRTVLHLPRH